ncbi:WhiB family transcriptional regulator [Nocardia sp. NPDC088792]|uniref:WhiB family transcriptional regulator n=1 Tax=Nocardia sp. NPDC088792 TaxID=3364332 RepID=UPI003800363F
MARIGKRSWTDSPWIDTPPWRGRAACARFDPETFFPRQGRSSLPAKRICVSCNVREQCLDFALTHSQIFGIWGGMTPRERQQFRRPETHG